MPYNTGAPVGSTSPKDLLDNAVVLDVLVNGDALSHPDRKGVPRKSWRGMEVEHNAAQVRREAEFDADQTRRECEFDAYIDASGFENPPIVYTDGSPVQVDRVTQLVERGGNLYTVRRPASFPYTLSGVWATDQTHLVLRNDQAVRQDLADHVSPLNGLGMLGYKRSDPTQYSPEAFTAKRLLDSTSLSVWGEFSHLVTDRPDPNNYTTWDWYPALQAAVNQAFNTVTLYGVYCSNVNHSGVVLDLGGFSFRTTQPITTPTGGGVTVKNGMIFAATTFPTTRYVWELGVGTSVFLHENVVFDNVVIDSRHRGGGLLVQNSIRTQILHCKFMRFGNGLNGVRTGPSGGVFETLLDDCSFGYASYGNTVLDTGATFSGFGLHLGSTDNRVLQCIFYTRGGIYIGAQGQRIADCQFYGSASDIAFPAIEVRSSSVKIVDCDFGKRSIHVYSPFNVTISDNDFIMENTTADDYAIALIPTSAGETMAGVLITDNNMHRVGGVKCGSIKYDTSLGTIVRVKGSKIGPNVFFGVKEVATSYAKNMFVTAGQTATFDFSDVIPFGVIASVQHGYANQLHATAIVALNLAGNLAGQTRSAVTLKLGAASTGNFMCVASVEEPAD